MTQFDVSVVMAVHNGERYLAQAINSVLCQTRKEFEFVIVNDGSTDETAAILRAYAVADDRVCVLANSDRRGLAQCMNKAIAKSSGRFIARMDADDIALPCRLAVQAETLDTYPGIAVVGSNAIIINEMNERTGRTWVPQMPDTIRATCLVENPFIHPSVMIRREVLTDLGLTYDETFPVTQDFRLWSQILPTASGMNIERPLMFVRRHGASVSVNNRSLQHQMGLRVITDYGRRLLDEQCPTKDRFDLIKRGFLAGRADADRAGVDRIDACQLMLDLAAIVMTRDPTGDYKEYFGRIAWRCAKIGLLPPIKPGWLGLIARLSRAMPALVGRGLHMASLRARERFQNDDSNTIARLDASPGLADHFH